MAEPRRAWDRARERVERALDHLHQRGERETSMAVESLERALEDLAGTEHAVAPIYVVVHGWESTTGIRGVYTTHDAAKESLATERWIDVVDGHGDMRTTDHSRCCSIEERLLLDEPPDVGDGELKRLHEHAWIQVTDPDGNTRQHCRMIGCFASAPGRRGSG